jgi:hypothetical protein
MITDGQVHDLPNSLAALGLDAPLHGLIVGDENEVDRRIDVLRSPRLALSAKIRKSSIASAMTALQAASAPVIVTVRVNGEEIASKLP